MYENLSEQFHFSMIKIMSLITIVCKTQLYKSSIILRSLHSCISAQADSISLQVFFVVCWTFKKILSDIPSVSNSLDPDQARHFVTQIWVQTAKVISRQKSTLEGKEVTLLSVRIITPAGLTV